MSYYIYNSYPVDFIPFIPSNPQIEEAPQELHSAEKAEQASTQTYVPDIHHQMALPAPGVEAAMTHGAPPPMGRGAPMQGMVHSHEIPMPAQMSLNAAVPGHVPHSVISVDDSQNAYARTSDKVDQFTSGFVCLFV